MKPMENQDTELSCDSQHSWLFNTTMKCHHLVKATAVLSPTDTCLSTHATKTIWDSTIKIFLPFNYDLPSSRQTLTYISLELFFFLTSH